MKLLDKKQIKEIANFFTTTAVAWFSAGVIAPLFAGSGNSQILVLSITLGFIMALVFMSFSVIIIRSKQ